MGQLAKVDLAAAAACPNCRQRVTDLNLDQLASGAEHQCLFCGHFMRVPQTLIDRLLQQREAERAEQASKRSIFARLSAFFEGLFKK